jgi:hypothetical protein
MRCWHPGYETRRGYTPLSTVATNAAAESIFGMYQFANGKSVDKDMFVQYGDGLLYIQNGTIPDKYTGEWGDLAVYSDSSFDGIPASFADVDDIMIYSDGYNQHRVYCKNKQVDRAVVVRGSSPHAPILGTTVSDEATDYTEDMKTDKDDILLNQLGNYDDDDDALYIMTMIPFEILHVEIDGANSETATLKIETLTFAGTNSQAISSDGTLDSGSTLAIDGDIVLTGGQEATPYPVYLFGEWGYWYRLEFSAQLSANVRIETLTYSATHFPEILQTPFGFVDLVEAFHYDASESAMYNYATDSIDMSLFDNAGDFLYLVSAVPLQGISLDWGATLQSESITTITIEGLHSNSAGTQWDELTKYYNGTGNMRRTGLITWGDSNTMRPQQWNGTQYYAYWYRISVDVDLSDNVNCQILGMPTYIGDQKIDRTFGKVGNVCASWKNRACYTFKKFPRDIYVSANGNPMVLNGPDFAILQPGDGRANATKSIENFYNEIMVWQEERGKEGGCTTLFEGYSPETFGKIVLSTKIGTLNAKSTAIVDGSKSSTTTTDVKTQTMAFWLSHYGVFMSDGKVVTAISDDIQNYFDERFSECLREGYENEMWLAYDSTENVIKIGIVSGGSATICNKFFVYDLTDGVWYEDVYADSFSCFTEVQADTGDVHAIQVAGGSISGFVYQMNIGTNDNTVKIDAKLIWEFSQGPYFIDIDEILTRCRVQGAQTEYTWVVEENDVAVDDGTKSMAAEFANQTMRRNRHQLKVSDIPWSSFTIRANVKDVPLYLYDMAILTKVTEFK